MSYRISYLVPKKEFERLLLGKKQTRAVQEAPAKKSSTPSRKAKPKKASSAPRRHTKSKTTKKLEKTRGKQSGVRKKRRVQDEERDPWAWGKNQTTTEIQRWGESEPSPKKSKKENVEKYFDDVPQKKTKVSRLMKFMDKNKEHVQVGDDFEILIRNRPIPGSDFIEIMNYLQKGPGAKVHTFIPTRDPGTGMPVGTRRFIDALHEAIEGEPIPGDMDAEDVNKFAKKLSEFAGLKMDGVEEIVKEVTDDRGRRVGEIRVDNRDYLAEQEADEAKQAEEQDKARQVLLDMEAEEREVRERQAREAAERARNKRRKQKKFAYTMLKRIKDDVAEEPLTSSDDEDDVEESRRDVKHRKRKQLVKSMKTLGALIDETMKGETVVDPKTKETLPKKSLATKTYDRYVATKKSSPKRFREVYTLDHLDKLYELSLRRAEKKNVPTVKELIKLEEKSVRAPTVKEVLKDKPLDTFADVRKNLSFSRESDEEIALEDAPEVEPGEEEEEEEPGEETETR